MKKFRLVIFIFLGIAILNGFLWYQLSLGFFDFSTRLFFALIFNQIFLVMAIIVSYFHLQIENLKAEIESLKLVMSLYKKNEKNKNKK